jgi:hypothetical protein
VDHAHASQVARDALDQEIPQCVVRGVTAQPVQVDLRFDRVLAALQTTEQVFGHRWPTKRDRVAAFEPRRIDSRSEAVLQHFSARGTCESRDRLRPRSAH